ncbi:MAG: hypothetical protein ACTTKH_01745 [Treponema sp.]
MKLSNLKTLFYVFIVASFIFSCNHGNNKPTDQQSIGNLDVLKVHGKEVDLKNWSVIVPNDKTEVKTGDVDVSYKINGAGYSGNVSVKNSPVMLKENENVDVELMFEAVAGKHEAFTRKIKVKRAPKGSGETSSDPELVLASLSIHGKDVENINDMEKLSITLRKSYESVSKDNVKAQFILKGKNIDNIEVKVINEPVQLVAGKVTNVVLLVDTVPGKYKEWKHTVKVTREAYDPELDLASLKIHGKDVENINDVNNLEVDVKATKVEKGDIEASFELDNKPVTVELKVENEPVQLEKGKEKLVTLVVDAKPGKYREWKHVVKITRFEDGETLDPKLKFVSLKIWGREVDEKTWSVIVPLTSEKVEASNVEAQLKLGTATSTYPVTVTNEPINLPENTPTEVEITVAAKPGNYRSWTRKVMVTRKSPELKLVGLKIDLGIPNPKEAIGKKTGDKWSVELPASFEQITNGKIHAFFEWEGMGNPKPRELTVTTEPALPISLATGEEKEITLKVEASSEGKYQAWNGKVTVKRRDASKLELKKIKLFGKPLQTTEITNLTSPDVIETIAQKVNLSFFSEMDANVEDQDLVTRITTEPELVETNGQGGAKIRTWELKNKTNTLKIMVGGKLKCTLTVNRKPLEVENIAVFRQIGGDVASKVEEGKEYSTVFEKILIQVIGKEGLTYNSMKATLSGTIVNLKKDTQSSTKIKEIWIVDPNNPITLSQSSNPIILTIQDENNIEDLKFVRNFTLNKLADPSTGPIDPSVAIEDLWIGDGAMNKENTNKFKALKNSSDSHKYTVQLPKTGYNDKKVSLIVKGATGATNADIIDGSEGSVSAKANGSSIFKSGKEFIDVKANSNKYIFQLKNADKVAQYEITVSFTLAGTVTPGNSSVFTITQPANGVIKAYKIASKGGVPQREEIPIQNNTITFKKAKYSDIKIYFELIATTPHTPKSLTVGDKTENTVTTNDLKQTQGAIVIEHKIPKGTTQTIAVSGECN